MRVNELKQLLEAYPQDMEVVYSKYGDWVMMSHHTMSADNKEKEKSYLCLS